ncbi:Cys-tRNA(Pro)/Cys-tRNA(Cys) deacylase [Enterococcus sp. AZ191]
MEKTKVENYLDDLGVRYQPIDFRKEDLENFEAVLQAQKIDPQLVCKTLVLKGDKTGVIIAIVPLAAHLDYKKKREKCLKITKLVFPVWTT